MFACLSRTLAVLVLAALCSGCVGNGALLQDIECKGKITIVGGGSGFSGLNGNLDCGDGFVLKSGEERGA